MMRLLLVLFLAAGLVGTASADVVGGIKAYQRGDYATALRELKPLAEQDDVDAQFHLGEMYLRGRGVDQDFEAAAAWYTKAAQGGHPRAQETLGGLHAIGLGVPQDLAAAYFWLITAAIWDRDEIRQKALQSLGEVARLLDQKEKSEIARQATKQWRK